jgi:hypothetical protein
MLHLYLSFFKKINIVPLSFYSAAALSAVSSVPSPLKSSTPAFSNVSRGIIFG